MLVQTDLVTLKKGDQVDHFLMIRKCEIRTRKDNRGHFLFLELGDKSTAVNSNMWENFEQVYSSFKCGDIVKVIGIMDDYQGTPQIKVAGIRLAALEENVLPADFMAKSKRDHAEMKQEFLSRLEGICDYKLRMLMREIFSESSLTKFSTAPAGKSWHHSYIHGLIEHTLEVVRICDLMCDIHPELNRDLLICGAMLHDFGKTEELSYESFFEYTDKGKLLGHIVIAAMVVNEESKKIPGFPEELKNCLLHLILSHQGKLEYASPVVPKTVEAIALYQADELSAKVNAYKNAINSEIKNDGRWTKFLSIVSTDLFNHRLTSEIEEEIKKTLFD
jgi:3'-5' exoribonuclease